MPKEANLLQQIRKERVLLTPEKAKGLISHNYPQNRKISETTVLNYANDIRNGRWNEDVSYVDQPLMISPEGWLLNGQHRCWAVIKANKSIYVWIYYNVSEELYKFLDCGKVRSAKDFIDLPNGTNIAALVKFVCCVEDGNAPLASATQGKLSSTDKIKPSRAQIIEKTYQNPEYYKRMITLSQKGSTYLGKKTTFFADAIYLIDYVGRGHSLEAFVAEMAEIKPESNTIIMSRTYITNKLATKSFKSTRNWYMGCIFFAYENYIKSNEVESFNKSSYYFSKYDLWMREERRRRKGE